MKCEAVTIVRGAGNTSGTCPRNPSIPFRINATTTAGLFLRCGWKFIPFSETRRFVSPVRGREIRGISAYIFERQGGSCKRNVYRNRFVRFSPWTELVRSARILRFFRGVRVHALHDRQRGKAPLLGSKGKGVSKGFDQRPSSRDLAWKSINVDRVYVGHVSNRSIEGSTLLELRNRLDLWLVERVDRLAPNAATLFLLFSPP